MLIEQFASSGEADAFPYLKESEFEGIYGLYAQPDKRVLSGGTVTQEDFSNNFARISKDELGFVNPEAFAGATGLYMEDYVFVPTQIAEFSSPLEAQSLCASICENSPLCTAGFQMDENSSPSLGLTYGCVSSCYYDILSHQNETQLTSASCSYDRHFSSRRNVVSSSTNSRRLTKKTVASRSTRSSLRILRHSQATHPSNAMCLSDQTLHKP